MKRDDKGRFVKGENIVDRTGQKFGMLTALRLSDRISGRKTFWIAECECGNLTEIRSDHLGKTQSCGCLKKKQDKINLTANHSHKESKTRLYKLWTGMKGRCFNKNNDRYSSYGSRGITVCDEWTNSYEAFRDWAYSNGYDDTLSIERIDNDGNYEPNNCEWIPFNEQANNRRTTIWITFNNKTQNMTQWCNELGLTYGTVNARYSRGERNPEKLLK